MWRFDSGLHKLFSSAWRELKKSLWQEVKPLESSGDEKSPSTWMTENIHRLVHMIKLLYFISHVLEAWIISQKKCNCSSNQQLQFKLAETLQEFKWGLWSLLSVSHLVLKCFNPGINLYILTCTKELTLKLSCLCRSYTVPPTHTHTALDLIKWSNPIFVTINYRNHRSFPLEWNELPRKRLCHYRRLWRGFTKIMSVASRTLCCCCCKQHRPSKRHTLLIRKLIFLLLKLVDKRGAAEVIYRGCARVSCRCIGVCS